MKFATKVALLALTIGMEGCRCGSSGSNSGPGHHSGQAAGSGTGATDFLSKDLAGSPAKVNEAFSARYEDMISRYERLLKRTVGSFRQNAARSSSLEDFFERTGPSLDKYDRTRSALHDDYASTTRLERQQLNQQLRIARQEARQAGDPRKVRTFLSEEQRRERVRRRQVRRLQKLLDESADEVGETFRKRFHERLNSEVNTLNKNGSSPEAAQAMRKRMEVAIEQGFASTSDASRQRSRYSKHWVGWFLRDAQEAPPKKTADPVLPEQTDRVVLRPARPDGKVEVPPHPTNRPGEKSGEKDDGQNRAADQVVSKRNDGRDGPARSSSSRAADSRGPATTVPRVDEADLDCKNNECDLAQYRRFVERLARSCPGSRLPDLLIKECFRDFVYLNLSTPRRREVMNFLRFSSENRYDRERGLSYFSERCYRFRPVTELARQMLKGDSGLLLEEKLHIERGLEKLRSCR